MLLNGWCIKIPKKLTKKQVAQKIRLLRKQWEWIMSHISTDEFKSGGIIRKHAWALQEELKKLQQKADKGELEWFD